MASNLIDRATNAYFARMRRTGAIALQPSRSDSDVCEHAGRQYVILENINGRLAVYRVLNSGKLKYLKRWPSAVVA